MEKESLLKMIKDEKFLNEIVSLTDVEDVKKAFKSRGIDITDKNIEEMRQGASEYMSNMEVSEEFLDNIVGGVGWDDQQPIIINNYINNDNTNINKSGSKSSTNNINYNSSNTPMTNAGGIAVGSIFVMAGALVISTAIRSGIRNGWLAPM